MTDTNRTKSANFRKSFTDVSKGEICESEEGAACNDWGED